MPERLHQSIFDNPFLPPLPEITVDDDKEIARAIKLAEEAEVTVLVLGESQIMIGEHAWIYARSAWPPTELLEGVLPRGTPTVLIIMSGRPLDLKGAKPDAQLMICIPVHAAVKLPPT